MNPPDRFLVEHLRLTRRFFLRAGLATASGVSWLSARGVDAIPPELAAARDKLEPFFTTQTEFRDVSRGTPLPHKLPDDKKREVGLTRETWKLEISATVSAASTCCISIGVRRPITCRTRFWRKVARL